MDALDTLAKFASPISGGVDNSLPKQVTSVKENIKKKGPFKKYANGIFVCLSHKDRHHLQ
jgi:hypothetical protein